MFTMPRGTSLASLLAGLRPDRMRASASAGTAALPSRETMMAGLQRAASDPVDLTKKLTAGSLRQGKASQTARAGAVGDPGKVQGDVLAAQRMRLQTRGGT